MPCGTFGVSVPCRRILGPAPGYSPKRLWVRGCKDISELPSSLKEVRNAGNLFGREKHRLERKELLSQEIQVPSLALEPLSRHVINPVSVPLPAWGKGAQPLSRA